MVRCGDNEIRETEFSQPQYLCGKFDRRRNAQTRGKVQQFTWVCVYSTYRKSACTNFTSTCHRYIATNARSYTDSLIYHIECDDVYKNMKRDIARFDTNDYSADNVYGMPLVNKKIPGLMKNENNGGIMIEFVGLKAKMYDVRVDGKKDTKKAKGIRNNVITRTITFDDYMRCLNEEIEMTRRQSCI